MKFSITNYQYKINPFGVFKLSLVMRYNSLGDTFNTEFIYILTSILRYEAWLFTVTLYLFSLQGQDLYNSKPLRDKQIVRILGKVSVVLISVLFSYYTNKSYPNETLNDPNII